MEVSLTSEVKEEYVARKLSTRDCEEDSSLVAAKKHPLGVRPSGNALTSETNALDYAGLFARLPDALVLLMLEYLDSPSLVSLGGTCRAFYAYTTYDQLWRDIAVNNMNENFSWRGSWRASLLGLRDSTLARVDCGTVFSDALHRPFLCSQLPLEPYSGNIPKRNRITRMKDLSIADFNESWADKAFILTEPVRSWRAAREWKPEELLSKYGSISFRCEAVDWPLETYLQYMYNNQDESPLYLFDSRFYSKMLLSQDAFWAAQCFSEDLFTLLKEQRPDHEWLIIGPAGSGSTFHKDPNATSAWNAVINGSKYWIMFPNHVLPPGVYMSEDESEVTSPLSIGEWLLSFHAEARNTPGCIEGICHEGEVLHVPSGWWHLVVNLSPAIAITQNFVPRSHVKATVSFLKHKANQVSGFKESVTDPYKLFLDRLNESYPDLAASLGESNDKKRKWEDVVRGEDETHQSEGMFSFGFGDDIDEEEEEA